MNRLTLTRKIWGLSFIFLVFIYIMCFSSLLPYMLASPIALKVIELIALDAGSLGCFYYFLLIAENYLLLIGKRVAYSILMLIPVLFVLGLNLLFTLA